jgi:metallo-beta-lactamase family protein
MRDVYCDIYTLNGFSAHADQGELVEFARKTQERGKLKTIILVHGDEKPKRALKERLESENICGTIVFAERGGRLRL